MTDRRPTLREIIERLPPAWRFYLATGRTKCVRCKIGIGGPFARPGKNGLCEFCDDDLEARAPAMTDRPVDLEEAEIAAVVERVSKAFARDLRAIMRGKRKAKAPQ